MPTEEPDFDDTERLPRLGNRITGPDIASPPGQWRVRIRMYRQGVGDCFLLTFSNDGTPVHMLIDCGVLPASPAEHNYLNEVATAVRNEVEKQKGKLDVVVITHEHADHVSAFEPGTSASATLDKIPVKEVWMAWTENPLDEVARRLNHQLDMHALTAAAAREQMRSLVDNEDNLQGWKFKRQQEDIDDLLANFGIAPGVRPTPPTPPPLLGVRASKESEPRSTSPMGVRLATTVRAAIDHVKSREKEGAKLKTFLPGREIQSIPGVPLEKVRVFVLGPPHLDDLKKAPRHGKNDDIFHLAEGNLRAQARGFAAALGMPLGEVGDQKSSRPFSNDHDVSTSVCSPALEKLQRAYAKKDTWRKIDDDWLRTGSEFAMQLNSATNNTSLVLAIELVDTGEVLLFPGDAQIENWETWRHLKWTVPGVGGNQVEVSGEDLLRRTAFYKVSHHGSHNGTLDVHGVQLMPSSGLVAMCPVIHEVTKERRGDWKEIPKPSLCAALEAKCGEGFLRMDAEPRALAGRLDGRVQESDLWIDYYLV